MASPHPQLPRLHIPQQGAPVPQALFTPGLPSALQGGFPLVTPLNTNFGNQVPPRHAMHRAHPSLIFSNPAAFATTIPGHPGIPMTPGGIPAAAMLGGPGFYRNRRTPSVSLGGPPKAVLGGPNRKVSPMPAAPVPATPSASGVVAEKSKVKKAVVKFPLESATSETIQGDKEIKYSLWSRIPLKNFDEGALRVIIPPEIITMEPHPMEVRGSFPATIDVYLPGKSAWDEYFQKLVEEKLERLGVENGGNSVPASQPHLHGRAASISSPADPTLLMFKLNKLQQSQNTSLAVSPQPPSSVTSVSPNPQLPPRFQQVPPRHGHSFSLANYTPVQAFTPPAAFNPPISPNGYGLEQMAVPPPSDYFNQSVSGPLHAPQGVAPVSFNIRSETATASSGPSRVASTIPDFNRGFGIDIPEEDEEALQAFGQPDVPQMDGVGPDEEILEGEDDATTAGAHTRHASKASITMSIRNVEIQETIEENAPPELDKPVEWNIPPGSYSSPPRGANKVAPDFTGEWTSTEQSMGEYSNPSDEERAKQDKNARRMARANEPSGNLETPRRLPEFPQPPSGRLPETYLSTDDDIVSNPSDEERITQRNSWLHPGSQQPQQDYAYYQPIVDGQPRSPRPLPPLPHSRTASGQYSHPPTVQHSRQPSRLNEGEPGVVPRRDSLNPFAKPFVFGVGSTTPDVSSKPSFDIPGEHNRQQSSGRPLNAAAAVFKPGFTFVPPAGVPTISFPPAEPIPRPLPQPPIGVSPSRVQGREKRQRRDSQGSVYMDEIGEGEDGHAMMSTFKFPPPSNPIIIRPDVRNVLSTERLQERPISPLPQRKSALNAAAVPFTFNPSASTLSAVIAMPESSISQQSEVLNAEPQTPEATELITLPDQVTYPQPEAAVSEPSPSFTRKRPPVLDFKHPTSTHTVPAALFRKALLGTDLESSTRASVRSRLSSREIFEHMNSPSLDDTNVPAISRRGQLAARSNLRAQPDNNVQDKPHIVPQTGATSPPISESKLSDYTRRQEEAEQLEQRLEDMLDDRMDLIKKDLVDTNNRATDHMIAQIISAVKAHVSEIAGRLENDGDARGEIDFELIRNTLEHGVMDIRTGLRRDLEEVLRTVEAVHNGKEHIASGRSAEFQHVMEELGNRSVSAVSNAAHQILSRIEQIEQTLKNRADEEREAMMNEIFGMISGTLRQPGLDFDVITAKLADAVKPNISQLIDLTSDKRETAGLIVQHLMPTLNALAQNPAQVDTDAIVSHIRVELARMVPAADPHVLKEAVADLVVERIDSRLAVREKANSAERLYSFISERIDDLHVPVSDVRKAVEELHTGQEAILEQGETLNTLHQDMAAQLLGLPVTIENAIKEIRVATEYLTRSKDVPTSAAVDFSQIMPDLEAVNCTVRKLATSQEYLASQSATLTSLQEGLQNSVASLPQSFVETIKVLKDGQDELLAKIRSSDSSQTSEIRNLLASNAELQVQIAKARGAHGQIRVEKDLMFDRMTAAESERDSLRAQLEELRSKTAAREAEMATAGSRITELEGSLSHARARLESSETTSKAKDERIATVERQNREYSMEQYQLTSKIQKLELQEEWYTRDKATLEERLAQLQKDRNELLTQQSRWEELRRTSDQVEDLTKLIKAAESAEITKLKGASNRAKIIEAEHTALQKKYKEQEAKIADLERSSLSTRQNFAQAQQRISEWEKRANELEADLEATRSRLEEADEAKLQLDSDLSLIRMHLEKKEAAEKDSKELETKLQADIYSLESQVSELKAELDKVKQTRAPAPLKTAMSATQYWAQNGYASGQNARPPSRTSTISGGKSPVTPTVPTSNKKSQYSHAPSEVPDSPGGVSTSMYAPRNRTRQYYARASIPSPTPSTVTQGEDGWWS